MGVVINRPTEMPLSVVLPELKALQSRDDTIFLGGPVFKNQLLFLVQTDVQPGESLHVFQNVYAGSNPKVIEQMLKNESGGDRFRVYAGYAGWGPGQLAEELTTGSWLQASATTELV